MIHHSTISPIQTGKYLVSPLVKRLPGGLYAASVSIRSGTGSATHDRVLRLAPVFEDLHAAMGQASDLGLAWIRRTSSAFCNPKEA